jgi:hypothetical protein
VSGSWTVTRKGEAFVMSSPDHGQWLLMPAPTEGASELYMIAYLPNMDAGTWLLKVGRGTEEAFQWTLATYHHPGQADTIATGRGCQTGQAAMVEAMNRLMAMRRN